MARERAPEDSALSFLVLSLAISASSKCMPIGNFGWARMDALQAGTRLFVG